MLMEEILPGGDRVADGEDHVGVVIFCPAGLAIIGSC